MSYHYLTRRYLLIIIQWYEFFNELLKKILSKAFNKILRSVHINISKNQFSFRPSSEENHYYTTTIKGILRILYLKIAKRNFSFSHLDKSFDNTVNRIQITSILLNFRILKKV